MEVFAVLQGWSLVTYDIVDFSLNGPDHVRAVEKHNERAQE